MREDYNFVGRKNRLEIKTYKEYMSTIMSKTGRVYKMYFRDHPNDLYVGSTTQTLAIRMQIHKYDARHKTHVKSYWFEHLRTQDLSLLRIELLEEIKYDNKNELLLAEDRYIRELKPKFNTNKAYVTDEERKNSKICYMKNYSKNYNKTPQRKAYEKQRRIKPERIEYNKMLRQKNVDEQKYKCMNCDKCFAVPSYLKAHCNSLTHKATITVQAINELENLTNHNLFN